jgi:HSP20 family protein
LHEKRREKAGSGDRRPLASAFGQQNAVEAYYPKIYAPSLECKGFQPWRRDMAQAMAPLGQSILAPRYKDPFQALRSEMDQLFDSFLTGALPSPRFLEGWQDTLVPSLDMREDGSCVTIEAELPGLDIKDVELTVDNGVLTLTGERKLEKHEQKESYHVMERRYGRFDRSIRLPETVDENRIEAKFDKGILCVTLQKKPEAVRQQKKIAIQSA